MADVQFGHFRQMPRRPPRCRTSGHALHALEAAARRNRGSACQPVEFAGAAASRRLRISARLQLDDGRPEPAAARTWRSSGSMNRDTRIPAPTSPAPTRWATRLPAASSPPSVVTSSRRSGTRHTAWDREARAMRTISPVAAISRFTGAVTASCSRLKSSSRMCLLSSLRCSLIPSAPASSASSAARTGSSFPCSGGPATPSA